MTTIYLVRHGENPANINREFSYRTVDYSLTPRGVEQAQQTAAYFRNLPIRAVYASPLKRAIETAQIIAEPLGLDIVVLEQFREVNVGSLENVPPTPELWAFHDQIMEDWYAGRHDVTFPDGENYLTLLARLQDGLQEIIERTPDGPSIVVAHGGIFLALRDICHSVEISTVRQGTRNCAITEIDLQRADDKLIGELRRWADYANLE